MIQKITAVIGCLVLAAALPLWGQGPIAISGARVLTVSQGVIENGTIVVEGGKIAAVGSDLKIPAGAQIIDGRGKVVIPGMFDAGNQLGLVEIPFEEVTDDSTEYTDPIHPELRVVDALNARSRNIRIARPAGIANAVVTPAGGNLISGQSALIQLNGDSTAEMVVKTPLALHVNLGEESKETYGNSDKSPKTRMGAMAMLRQVFMKAQRYKVMLDSTAGNRNEAPTRDLKMESLVSALNREIPVVVRANRLGDIESAIRLADEFKLRLILADATSAWRIAGELRRRDIPVILGPLLQAPSRIEAVDSRLDNAALLHKAGVTIAIQTSSSNGVRDLWFAVGYAIANGLPDAAALQAVTLNPARIFGVDDRLGSIEVGKSANLVILDGEPFRVKTHATTLLIGGRVVDLSNHQTELYEVVRKKYGIN
ncbi:MAG TPA: amidohydrolase family protein [Candidatus Nanoarchaeia archaeon]|nr:amidohydrolase family protein [Candidatus Nanoarchaeia archaeon]